MELVADRFAVSRGGSAIDLAKGERVTLLVSTAGARPEQARWAARCARLVALWHGRLAPLVDYGGVGDVRRFEAWRSEGAWEEATAEADLAVACGAAFLHANGLTGGVGVAGSVGRLQGRAVYVPPPAAGYEREAIDGLGLAILPRATLSAVADDLASTSAGRARALAV